MRMNVGSDRVIRALFAPTVLLLIKNSVGNEGEADHEGIKETDNEKHHNSHAGVWHDVHTGGTYAGEWPESEGGW